MCKSKMTFLLDYLTRKSYRCQRSVFIAFVIATKFTMITSIRFRASFFKRKNDDSAFSTTSHHLVDAKFTMFNIFLQTEIDDFNLYLTFHFVYHTTVILFSLASKV